MVTGDSAGGGLTVSSALEVSHRVFYLDQTLHQKVPLKAIVPVYPGTVRKKLDSVSNWLFFNQKLTNRFILTKKVMILRLN